MNIALHVFGIRVIFTDIIKQHVLMNNINTTTINLYFKVQIV